MSIMLEKNKDKKMQWNLESPESVINQRHLTDYVINESEERLKLQLFLQSVHIVSKCEFCSGISSVFLCCLLKQKLASNPWAININKYI